jgi:erythronate-4-phosphate dehydrogenase
MKIVIDDKIPFIRDAFEPYAEVVYCPGRDIDSLMVKDADALIVRTRTKCNKALLDGSRVKIVASATIGYDHIDTFWCENNGIRWVNAPGCNSGSVMQYITASLFFLSSKYSLDLRSMTLGVVGVGNVGSKVVAAAKAIGMKVLQNDPPRKRRENISSFISLDKLLAQSDIVTIHVPYTKDGHDKTHYLLNSENLYKMKEGSFLINSSRGEVVDNSALRKAVEKDYLAGTILDVWEGEPDADRKLIALAEISTPHIAGYSVDGKANGTMKAVHEVSATLGLPLGDWRPSSLPEPAAPFIDLLPFSRTHSSVETVGLAVKATYPIEKDNNEFKKNPEKFESLRDNYWKRREFSSFTALADDDESCQILTLLGFKIK